jgi:dihydrofolate reductase
MRYWDEEQPGWDETDREFARIWRDKKKWVVSRSLKFLGPNAALVEGDLKAAICALKAEHTGEIPVAGPDLAASLGEFGLIDEYRLYLRPVVIGGGKPFFTRPRPPLRLIANDLLGEDVVRLAYVPA